MVETVTEDVANVLGGDTNIVGRKNVGGEIAESGDKRWQCGAAVRDQENDIWISVDCAAEYEVHNGTYRVEEELHHGAMVGQWFKAVHVTSFHIAIARCGRMEEDFGPAPS